MGVRCKLLIGLMVSTVVVITPFWLVAENSITQSLKAYQEERAAAALYLLSAAVKATGPADLQSIHTQVDLIKESDPNIKMIHYYTKKGTRVVLSVSTVHKAVGKETDHDDAIPFFTGQRQLIRKTNNLVEIHEPIVVKGRVVAVIGVYFSSPFHIRLWRQALFVLAGLLSLLIFAYALLNRAIIAPIRHLEKATASVAQGKLSTSIDLRQRDEFGSLADHFNDMLASLRRQDRENRSLHKKLQASYDRVQIEAQTDTLTQLFNRRHLEKRLTAVVNQSAALKQPLACVFCDLDGFKIYNDVYGHQQGDEALRTVGIIIRACLRETDIAARYGGEEFALILPDTDVAGARAVAERIRRAVANFSGDCPKGKPKLTISIGISMLNSVGQTAGTLIGQADQAMYYAKKSGKDRVVVFDETRPAVELRAGS